MLHEFKKIDSFDCKWMLKKTWIFFYRFLTGAKFALMLHVNERAYSTHGKLAIFVGLKPNVV